MFDQDDAIRRVFPLRAHLAVVEDTRLRCRQSERLVQRGGSGGHGECGHGMSGRKTLRQITADLTDTGLLEYQESFKIVCEFVSKFVGLLLLK